MICTCFYFSRNMKARGMNVMNGMGKGRQPCQMGIHMRGCTTVGNDMARALTGQCLTTDVWSPWSKTLYILQHKAIHIFKSSKSESFLLIIFTKMCNLLLNQLLLFTCYIFGNNSYFHRCRMVCNIGNCLSRSLCVMGFRKQAL